MDPYRALSFDVLHSLLTGLFGAHLWPVLKDEIEKHRADGLAQLDAWYVLSPILTCKI